MFKVTPIGSCRITTPLRHGQSSYGIDLNLERCYGYCHSPAEAVQMARFMQGDLEIPQDVWPLVSRSHQFDVIATQEHLPSDLYVIELASAKELSIDGVSVQLNYLNSIYRDFFSDTERAQRFWACAEGGDDDAMSAFIAREWSVTKIQQAQAEVLGRIRLNYVTPQSLRRNIRRLSRILPDVVFVSHVDACRPDGQKIGSRSKFINLVRDEVRRAGQKFYNPTDLMVEFGQAEAIEDDSTSLAHFTTAFSNTVMDDWMRNFIAPKTDAAVWRRSQTALQAQLLPQIAAASEAGRFADGHARLSALVHDAQHVQPLLDEFKLQQDEAQQVLTIEIAAAGQDIDIAARSQLIDKAGAHGLFETALGLATGAEGGLRTLPAHVLIKVGLQAAEAGDTDNAFEFVLAAYCRNHDLTRASRKLADLAINDEIDLLSELSPDELSGILSHLAPVQRLLLLQMNGAAATAAISASAAAQEVAEIVTYLAGKGGIEQAVEVMVFWRNQKRLDRIRDKGLIAILDRWVDAALSQGTASERLLALAAIMPADPRHPGLRNAMRDARVDLVHRIRDAGKAGDIEALDRLKPQVDALPAPLPEFDLWRARLRFDRGEFENAVVLGQSAAAHLPETINIWVLLMRAAVKTQDDGKAREFARKVIELACAKTEKLKLEAEAILRAQAVEA